MDPVCRCAHEEELHYGSDDRWCNQPGCECVKFVAVEPAGNEVSDVEITEAPPKRKRGRPRKT